MDKRKNIQVSKEVWEIYFKENKCMVQSKKLARRLKTGEQVYLFTKAAPRATRLAEVSLIQGSQIIFSVVDQTAFGEDWIRNHGVNLGSYGG